MRSNTGRRSRLAITIPSRRPSGANNGAATRMIGTCGTSTAPLAFSELDRRDVNVAGRQRDRLFEIVPIAIALKLCVGYGADGAARSRTIHANDFASAVGNADDAQVVVPRLRGKFRREPRRQPAPLCRLNEAGPLGDAVGTSHLIDG